jgi:hypothetical protein
MRVRATETTSVIVAVIACIGAIVSAFYSYSNRNRELNIELVKIGIGILRADPKETQTVGAREWAIGLIETYSGEKFSENARSELLQNKLNSLGYVDTYGDTLGYYGTREDRRSLPQSK